MPAFRHCLLSGLLLVSTLLPASAAGVRNPLRIAANPNLSPIELLANFGPLASALEKELGVKVELSSGKDYDDTLSLLKHRQVDIAGSGAFGFVSAQSDFGARLLVRYVEEGGESYRAVIITRVESDIHSVKDLKGKRFAFTDTKSTSGYLMPLLEMQRNGLDLKDLARADFVKKQPNAAIAVYLRQVDAGAIADNQLSEKYGVKLAELRTIWRSEPIYHGVWMAGPDMPDEELQHIRAALLKLAASPDAAIMFKGMSVKGFVEGRDSDFDNVRAAKRLLDQLEKTAQPR